MSLKLQIASLRAWHAVLAGGVLVAFLTADEDTYRIHLFSGFVVLGAVALRLAAGWLAPQRSPWRLKRGRVAAVALASLAAMAAAAGTGWLADGLPAAEDLHEGLANATIAVLVAHIAVMWFMVVGRKLIRRPA